MTPLRTIWSARERGQDRRRGRADGAQIPAQGRLAHGLHRFARSPALRDSKISASIGTGNRATDCLWVRVCAPRTHATRTRKPWPVRWGFSFGIVQMPGSSNRQVLAWPVCWPWPGIPAGAFGAEPSLGTIRCSTGLGLHARRAPSVAALGGLQCNYFPGSGPSQPDRRSPAGHPLY
jgi:hypothetical protein